MRTLFGCSKRFRARRLRGRRRSSAARAGGLARGHVHGGLEPPGRRPGCARAADRVPVRRIRSASVAAGPLGRTWRAGRRCAQGGLGPGAAVGGGRPVVPPGVLSAAPRGFGLAAGVLDRHRSRPASRCSRARNRRPPAYGHGDDSGRRGNGADLACGCRSRAAVPARRRPPRERPAGAMDHLAALRRQTRSPASRNTLCLASGACAPSRPSVSNRGSCTSTRATQGSPRWRLARREAARGASVEAAIEAARQRTVFTTHTPVAAGNETYSRDDLIGTLAGRDRRARCRPRADPGAGPKPRQTNSRRALRGDSIQSADESCGERCQPPARGGRAGDVARALATASRRGCADQACH